MKIDRDTAIKLVTEAGAEEQGVDLYGGAYIGAMSIEFLERLCNLAVEHAAKDAKPVAWGMTHVGAKIVDTITDDDRKQGMDRWADQYPVPLYTNPAIDDTALLKWIGPHKTGAEAINELRKAAAEIIGADPEVWPDHGNAPLAIGACLATRQNAVEQSSKDTALLRQALDALEHYREQTRPIFSASVAITALRKRLGDAQ